MTDYTKRVFEAMAEIGRAIAEAAAKQAESIERAFASTPDKKR